MKRGPKHRDESDEKNIKTENSLDAKQQTNYNDSEQLENLLSNETDRNFPPFGNSPFIVDEYAHSHFAFEEWPTFYQAGNPPLTLASTDMPQEQSLTRSSLELRAATKRERSPELPNQFLDSEITGGNNSSSKSKKRQPNKKGKGNLGKLPLIPANSSDNEAGKEGGEEFKIKFDIKKEEVTLNAFEKGDLRLIATLINEGANTEIIGQYINPLISAAILNDHHEVKLLLGQTDLNIIINNNGELNSLVSYAFRCLAIDNYQDMFEEICEKLSRDNCWDRIRKLDISDIIISETNIEQLQALCEKANHLNLISIKSIISKESVAEGFTSIIALGNITHLYIAQQTHGDDTFNNLLYREAIYDSKIKVLSLGEHEPVPYHIDEWGPENIDNNDGFRCVLRELINVIDSSQIVRLKDYENMHKYYRGACHCTDLGYIGDAIKENVQKYLITPYLMYLLKYHPNKDKLEALKISNTRMIDDNLQPEEQLKYAGGIMARVPSGVAGYIISKLDCWDTFNSAQRICHSFDKVRSNNHREGIRLKELPDLVDVGELIAENKRLTAELGLYMLKASKSKKP